MAFADRWSLPVQPEKLAAKRGGGRARPSPPRKTLCRSALATPEVTKTQREALDRACEV